jgi:hypothetical protein
MLNSKNVWVIKELSLYQFYDPIDQAKHHQILYTKSVTLIGHCHKAVTSSFQLVYCNRELLVCGNSNTRVH